MTDLIAFGAFLGGIWALSLLSLKVIRDSEHAESRLRDAAAAAIVALSFLAGLAASFAYGWNFLFSDSSNSNELGSSWIGAILASGLFLVPFAAMTIVYRRSAPNPTEIEELQKQMKDLKLKVEILRSEQKETADDVKAAVI